MKVIEVKVEMVPEKVIEMSVKGSTTTVKIIKVEVEMVPGESNRN